VSDEVAWQQQRCVQEIQIQRLILTFASAFATYIGTLYWQVGLTVSGCVLCAPSSYVSLCTVLSYSSKPQEWETETVAPVFIMFFNPSWHCQYFWPGSRLYNWVVIAQNIRVVSHCCYIYSGCVIHPISFNACKWLFLQQDKRLAFAADYWCLSWGH